MYRVGRTASRVESGRFFLPLAWVSEKRVILLFGFVGYKPFSDRRVGQMIGFCVVLAADMRDGELQRAS